MSPVSDGTPSVDASSVEASGVPQYIRGVPHPLPAGERLLWEGAPTARAMATHVFHWRLIAGYFAAMLAYWVITTELTPGTQVYAASLLVRCALSAFVLATVLVLARLAATTTWYAITSQRIVLRIGMVFTMSINIPFRIIDAAALGVFKDGTGQVALSIAKGSRIAYIALWPHCRVFTFNQPSPVLRGLTEPARVADILVTAVAAAAAATNDSASRLERGTGTGRVADAVSLPQPAGV
jgi:hypothetical protein